jgi:hypothetical protein
VLVAKNVVATKDVAGYGRMSYPEYGNHTDWNVLLPISPILAVLPSLILALSKLSMRNMPFLEVEGLV